MNLPLSFWNKIFIYVITVLFAPLGLYWFFKYAKNEDPEKRKVAHTVLVLTIVAVVLAVVIGIKAVNIYTLYLNNRIYGDHYLTL
ncbi:hypothetical protein A2415_03825 [candidate division WWE3 bacterium RIFOXYC1_FULL_39_7]|uniref:DUF5671 domain-containing protein n=2 Tax=Katanobacteria TaxID=422282 RepID=A0A1F4XAU1_UNCKA|nr:MAG: hypothetical protein A2415_03825 [candidate division WWE3 bacterium RIFOXYC1_FULL_39_7]OGC78183.1 MAG: hypothetical protein A2619_01845 [candidate division WWE3 bacterium RIFOXYD1_FULL_39_9]